MNTDQNHPAARFDESVATLDKRARLVVFALAATMVARVWDLGGRAWSIEVATAFRSAEQTSQIAIQSRLELADQIVSIGASAINVLLWLTAILFLRWTHRIVLLTRALGASDMKWKPADAVWAFFIPFISLIRPYQVFCSVQQRAEPEEITPPQPRVDRDGPSDYRNVAIVTPPLAKPLSHSYLGTWWGCFVALNVIGRISRITGHGADNGGAGLDAVIASYRVAIFLDVLALVAAWFAMRVVRSLTARVDERFRRIRHSTPEALAAQRIVLD